ncbi:unnamed protein product [Ectocarpus sp. 12 AP-2014]
MADSKRVRMSKREGALMARLSAKEQEVYEVQASARDLYRARRPVTDFARQVYTDPAINVEFQLLTAQLAEMENSLRLKEAELKELRTTADKADKDKGTGAAAKGTGAAGKPPPAGGTGSNSGASAKGESTVARASALVARCQRLEQENEELAASADVAKVAQLTSEKAVAEAYAGELKTALEEAYEYIEKLEEEREVHSTKVYALEEELRSVASQPRLHGQQQEQQQQPQQGHEQQQQQEQQQQHHEQEHQQHHQQQQQHQHQDHHDPHQHQQHQHQHSSRTTARHHSSEARVRHHQSATCSSNHPPRAVTTSPRGTKQSSSNTTTTLGDKENTGMVRVAKGRLADAIMMMVVTAGQAYMTSRDHRRLLRLRRHLKRPLRRTTWTISTEIWEMPSGRRLNPLRGKRGPVRARRRGVIRWRRRRHRSRSRSRIEGGRKHRLLWPRGRDRLEEAQEAGSRHSTTPA